MGARIARAIAVVVGAAGLLGLAPAVAGAWTTPVQVSEAGELTAAPRVAAGPSDSATALWIQTRTEHDPSALTAPRGVLRTALRDGSGTWSAPRTLSAVDRVASAHALAVGADGTRVAVWSEQDGSGEAVRAAIAAPGQTWSAAQTLASVAGVVHKPAVVVDGDGGVTVVWGQQTPGGWSVQASSASAGEDWTPAVELGTADPGLASGGPSVGVAGDDEVTATWAVNEDVQTATTTSTGMWSAAASVCAPAACQGAQYTRIAVADDGAAIAFWAGWSGTGTYLVQASERSSGGAWEEPATLATPQAPIQGLWLAGGEDDPAPVWFERDTMTTEKTLRSARRVAGSWAPATTLAETPSYSQPSVAVAGNDAGAGLTTWTRSGIPGVDPPILSTARQPDGTWGATLPVVPADVVTTSQVTAALSSTGDATVAWVQRPFPQTGAILYATGQEAGHVWDPPETSLGPDAPRLTNSSTPQFPLVSSQPGSTFACSIDQGPYEPCTSPYRTRALIDHRHHRLMVRATNAAGDFDPTPVRWEFVVDTRAPTIAITRPIPAQHFAQGAVVAPVFRCEDLGGAVRSCTAPSTLETSTPGPKLFTVTAVDEAGNVGEASVAYVVDAPDPPGGGDDPPGGGGDPPGGGGNPPGGGGDPPGGGGNPPGGGGDPPGGGGNPPGGGGNPPGGGGNLPGGGDRTGGNDRSDRTGRNGNDRSGDRDGSAGGGRSGGGDRSEGGTGSGDGVTTPTRPVKVNATGVVPVTTVSCRKARRCAVTAPRHVQVAIGGRRFRVAVLAPRHVRRGARVGVRLRLPRAALARLAGRRAVARVRIVLTAPGQPRSVSTVRVTLTRPA